MLPDTSKALSKGGNPLTECVSMGIGAQGGAVSVIGGSVRIGYVGSTNSQEGFQAFINGQHSYDSALRRMARRHEPQRQPRRVHGRHRPHGRAGAKTGSSGDNPIIDWNLTVGGIDYPYGAPTQFHRRQAVPVAARGRDEAADLGHAHLPRRRRQRPRGAAPLPREPGQAGDLLKRYLDFEIDDKDYLSSLTKYYDGTPLPAYDLASKPITTPAPDNKVLDKVTDSSGKQLIEYRYQPHDRIPGDNGETATPTGPETSSTTMPVNVGALKITLVSKQYADREQLGRGDRRVRQELLGAPCRHVGQGSCPSPRRCATWRPSGVDETDAGQKPGGNPHPSDQSLKVRRGHRARRDRRRGRTAASPPSPPAPPPRAACSSTWTASRWEGPIELRFEDKKDEKGQRHPRRGRQARLPAERRARRRRRGGGHYTQFFYTFKPSETDHLVPSVGAEGRHEVFAQVPAARRGGSRQAAPPRTSSRASTPPRTPMQRPRSRWPSIPIDPNPTTRLETPDGFDPRPAPSLHRHQPRFPSPPSPAPTRASPATRYTRAPSRSPTTATSPARPNPGRVELKIDTPSSGPITVETADGTILEAELVRDEDGNPVRDEDGNLTVLLDPEAVGKTELVIKQEPNGAFTGTTFIYDVTVRPDTTVAPAPALAKRAENLTHPGGPTQPGDRIRYTIEASNGAKGSLWTDVVVTDPLPACLELDEKSVRLDNPSAAIAGKELEKAASVAAGDVGKFSLSAPGAGGRQVLSAPAGDIGGGGSATVAFECTVRGDIDFSDPEAMDLGNIASATGKRPNPDGPDGPDVGPVAPPDTDPATPPGGGTVAPADPDPRVSKSVENLTAPGAGVTHLGDRLRYAIELSNAGAADSCLMGAVVSDPLPAGLEPVPGTLRLSIDGGEPIEVPDAAYDRASRTIAVTVGDLWGGHAAVLTFECTVGEAALGADAANVAHLHGEVPSESPDARPEDPDPGEPAEPPTGEPEASSPPAEPAPVIPNDPAEGDVSIAKEAENLSRADGTTRVGDTVRYTVTLRNEGAGTGWMDAVIRDDVPLGLEPLAGTIRLMLPDGTDLAVDDRAYDPATRVLAVACGQLYGGQEVVLSFDALVTGEAVGADIGNVALGYGTPPSAWDPDGTHPEPGAPFSPDGGWDAWEQGRGKAVSDPAYPPGADASGGVLDGDEGGKRRTTIAHKLAQTGDALLAAALLPLTLALAAGAALLASRRRRARSPR